MKEKHSSYYDNLRKNEWKETSDFGPTAKSRRRIIKKIVKKNSKLNSRILDCGCGSGNMLELLQNNSFKYLSGSDFSSEAIALTKTRFKGPLYEIDITQEKDFQEMKFDLIICADVLEHIENDTLAIENLNKALIRGGILIVTVPYSMELWSQHDDFVGHVRRYEINELEEKMLKGGFDIMDSFGWGNLIYPLYHRLLVNLSPKKVMNNKRSTIKSLKILAAKGLYYLFFLEDLSKAKKSARRLFVVGKKR